MQTFKLNDFNSISFKSILMFLIAISKHGIAATSEDLKIKFEYVLISSKPITRTVYEYTYRAKLTNTGTMQITSGTGLLKSLSPNTTVIDNTIAFTAIAPNATVTSIDTFTIDQDRIQPLPLRFMGVN